MKPHNLLAHSIDATTRSAGHPELLDRYRQSPLSTGEKIGLTLGTAIFIAVLFLY